MFFFPLPKFKHLDLRPFLFLFSSQGVRECRDECGWIKYQQQGVWAATGAQRNTLSVSNTMICTIFFSLKITSSTKTDLFSFDSCECPPSTECRYSYTDTTRGAYVYTCNTEVNKFAFFSENFKKQIFRVSSSPAAEPDAVRGVQPS